jgi:hypothetical protein
VVSQRDQPREQRRLGSLGLGQDQRRQPAWRATEGRSQTWVQAHSGVLTAANKRDAQWFHR